MSTDSVAKPATRRLGSAYRHELSILATRHCRTAMLVSVLMLLAACAKGMDPRSDDQTKMVPTEQAFALPEVGGPAVTAVLEKRYANGTEQDVLLATSAATPGQNLLRIQIFGPVDTSLASQDKLRAGYLPAKNVNAEMRKLIPGVRMQTSNYYVQNKYGPFGYAVGRTTSGDTCFYGWQTITSTGFAQTWIGNKGSIQVRLRLCDQNASEQRLLQSMYGYTINASFKDKNWNPYGVPLPPDEALGRPGAPMYPVSASRFETVTEPIGAPAPKASSSARRQTVAASRTAAQTSRARWPDCSSAAGRRRRLLRPAGVKTSARLRPPPAASPVVPPPPCLPKQHRN